MLPTEIKASTFRLFETDYASLPIPPTVAAYAFTYAEFVLPVCLVLGFATRFAALGLLVMTVLMQVYVMPGLWWTAHVYWVSILMVLMTVGPGAISIDAHPLGCTSGSREANGDRDRRVAHVVTAVANS